MSGGRLMLLVLGEAGTDECGRGRLRPLVLCLQDDDDDDDDKSM
jgi:hypothetical protein